MSDTSNTWNVPPPYFTGKVSANSLGTFTAGPVDFRGWMSFQAVGGDCYVLFGESSITCTTSTGWLIPEGTVQQFRLPQPVSHVYNASDNSGELRWYPSGGG